MDNDSDRDVYSETRPGRSILVPCDVSERPGVTVSPHMISLLDRSCQDCQQLTIDYDHPWGTFNTRPRFHLRKATSSAKLCPLCTLARMIRNHFSKGPPSSEVRVNMIRQWPQGFLTLGLRYDEGDQSRHHRNKDGGKGSPRLDSFQLDFNELGDSRHPVDQPHGVACSPKSPAGIAKLKEWIQTCDSEHPDCSVHDEFGSTARDFVPNRLIMLASSTNKYARLVSLTEPVHYVALSYCWGSSEQSKTIKSNVETRKGQILVTELPQTLQDAITMTQALDLKYLWIDSLCIIQDDEHDWAIESSKMADIYSSAWLVLAATGAPDCASGMLQTRESPLVINPNWLLETTVSINARRSVSHRDWRNLDVETQPLWQRAWAMQERELARRIVHFLPDELMWHCQTSTRCECGINDPEVSAISSLSLLSKLDHKRSILQNEGDFAYVWIGVLREYSHLELTKATDTLPALSGLAKFVERFTPGQYIAGMWEKDIAAQLAWCIDSDDPIRRNVLDEPSFSWVAAKWHVDWIFSSRAHYMPRCTFVTSTTSLATANPYGHILTSSITLMGRTLDATELYHILKEYAKESAEECGDDSDADPDEWFRDACCMDDPHCDPVHLLENSSRVVEGRGTVVVGFVLYQWREWRSMEDIDSVVLLLQRDATATAYKRIGLIPCLPSAFLEKKPAETVTII